MSRVPVLQRVSSRAFVGAILAMGILRFALTVSGVPNETVKYFSMSAIIMAGTVYYALTTDTHMERLRAGYLLFIPYMIIEVAALGYTWLTGHQTIFHANEYSFGTSIGTHTLGHLVGGLTWEPLGFGFLFMEIIWLIEKGVRRVIG
jgi:hypothetical protein